MCGSCPLTCVTPPRTHLAMCSRELPPEPPARRPTAWEPIAFPRRSRRAELSALYGGRRCAGRPFPAGPSGKLHVPARAPGRASSSASHC
ncbi:hypothetical protein EMIHUDRAFT_434270 [Emiliania huxleyi CCMP1516]|uniref:Uncharacterized protein n=2 Tax=Emiliania huxleyi TaxID=2903 RepID=A0A0D3K8Y4_EMIH1|nr:hypothetical protein EMIHUDRAFT_434270 [Emiliania huxleyi CCMP1516]EOD32219.1 hypothetical protein EMIHUDRAFT_434270 [Emiliania huxleyi CCMP1516]|eukprot:XP_005784648.1 hypothetical protein EMIHUDRAFT_434270 [Emiliania huxleyi CCMP1516]